MTIFEEIANNNTPFVDRFLKMGGQGIDVIIPVFNTNPFWKRNLYNYYAQIPINTLYVGDGGCTDDTLEVVKEFPRVKIIPQELNRTLGYCLRELISYVQTDWFIYLHADVFLPDGWFEAMVSHQNQYYWYECLPRSVFMVEHAYSLNDFNRALSGAQMGHSQTLKEATCKIEDDYLYRNEDIVIAELVTRSGKPYGRIDDMFHYHQVVNKKGEKEPKLANFRIERAPDSKWEIDTYAKQVYGIIKYLPPDKKYLVRTVNQYVLKLLYLNVFSWGEFRKWIRDNGRQVWNSHINRRSVFKEFGIAVIKALIKIRKGLI